jgi:nitroreductase
MLAFCLTARGHDRIETNETGTPLGTFNQSTGGFDTAPMGGLDSARVRTEFSIPEDAEVVALLAIGRTREPDKADPWRFSL